MPAMKVLETERLILRWFTRDDGGFILDLLNQPSWLRFIGDAKVRTLDDARAYIARRPVDSYERLGFGLNLVELKTSGTLIGMCGLVKRDGLADVDLGFAFLPEFWGRGYGVESATAVLEHANRVFGFDRIVAITSADNDSSVKLLERVGFAFEAMVRLPGNDEEVKLFARIA